MSVVARVVVVCGASLLLLLGSGCEPGEVPPPPGDYVLTYEDCMQRGLEAIIPGFSCPEPGETFNAGFGCAACVGGVCMGGYATGGDACESWVEGGIRYCILINPGCEA